MVMTVIARLNRIRWQHITRVLGIAMMAYGMFIDDSPERGTILMGGLGLLGLEKVAPPKARDSVD